MNDVYMCTWVRPARQTVLISQAPLLHIDFKHNHQLYRTALHCPLWLLAYVSHIHSIRNVTTSKYKSNDKISYGYISIKLPNCISRALFHPNFVHYSAVAFVHPITLSVNECFFISIRDPAQGYPSAMDYTSAISGPFCVLYSITIS
jgi:hypothetical protein